MNKTITKSFTLAASLLAASAVFTAKPAKAAKKTDPEAKVAQKTVVKVNKQRVIALKAEKSNLENRIAQGQNNSSENLAIKASLNHINSMLGENAKQKKTTAKKTKTKKRADKSNETKMPKQVVATQSVQTAPAQVETHTVNSADLSNISNARDKLVATAKSLRGVPYVWGGTNPATGLDCSGFTSYVYMHALGINTGRTTYNQDATGKHISLSSLKPGDLILEFGKGHVAMYIGNGMQIAAPEPGDHVKVQPVPYNYGAMYGLRYIA